jgi:uncharacterized repeat protein (TIGR03803 family)
MKTSKSSLTLAAVFACAAFTFSPAVRAQAQTVTYLAKQSSGAFVQATDGNFYGAGYSGASSFGEIFRMTRTGEVTTIHSFCSEPNCADGELPGWSGPILGSDGNLYGVTQGIPSTFYRLTLDGQFTLLYTFCTSLSCLADGESPTGIILASDGNFYGTMTVGGNPTWSGGTIFSISPTGQFKVLYTFCSLAKCADGQSPYFPPIQGRDGNFYGTTYSGGKGSGGVVYELTRSGTYTVLHNFCGPNDNNCVTGSGPSTIVQDSNGKFFGTAVYGFETAFELSSTHKYSVLHSFDTSAGGYFPMGGLTLASDGNFYGTNQDGGTANQGTMYEITPAGEFTVLYNFGYPQGWDPTPSPLFQGTDGGIYGTTLYGPAPCCAGTIFRLSNGMGRLVKPVPVAGSAGTSVLILGNRLTGTNSVTFNGVEANFTVESDTYIRATVPSGATTGAVSVVTPTGTLKSNPQFVVTK